jgi:hypothetical protein
MSKTPPVHSPRASVDAVTGNQVITYADGSSHEIRQNGTFHSHFVPKPTLLERLLHKRAKYVPPEKQTALLTPDEANAKWVQEEVPQVEDWNRHVQEAQAKPGADHDAHQARLARAIETLNSDGWRAGR